MPKLEIVAIQRPPKPKSPAADQQAAKSESVKLESHPAKAKKQVTRQRSNSSRPQPQSKPQPSSRPPSQSIGVFTGHLAVESDRLYLQCSDGVMLSVSGIDGKLSLWLMSHPSLMFAADDAHWLVYPKSDRRSGNLTVHLKSRLGADSEISLAPESGIVRGKLLAVDGQKMTIGIRRNISPNAFKELASKGMIAGTQLDQFVVSVWGDAPAEVGSIVDLTMRREVDRLVLSD